MNTSMNNYKEERYIFQKSDFFFFFKQECVLDDVLQMFHGFKTKHGNIC